MNYEPKNSPTTQQNLQIQSSAWDEIATGFDEFVTPMTTSLAENALQRVDLRTGMQFLDMAAGTGALALPAAHLGAQVMATDISPVMIERLRSRVEEEGLSNVEARVMNGYALDLEDDTFDVSASQNGVSLFPDLPRGLRELVRVTKPGGRVLIVAFGPLPKAEFISFFIRARQTVTPDWSGLPTDPPPLAFQVSEPQVLRERLSEAGLKEVRVERYTHHMAFQSATHFLDVITNSNPIGARLFADLTEEQRVEMKQVLEGMLRERSEGNGPAILNTEINIGLGTK